MRIKLVCHINDDGDLLRAWFDHYLRLGVASFHLIVHGPQAENARFFELAASYPVVIEDAYEGEYRSEEKQSRVNALLKRIWREWVLLVDSDEFVELPYRSLAQTLHSLERYGANALSAPMVQRLKLDGSLESANPIPNPFAYFPLCSIDLYVKMGIDASIAKFPLFYCSETAGLSEGGNHLRPHGAASGDRNTRHQPPIPCRKTG